MTVGGDINFARVVFGVGRHVLAPKKALKNR